MRVCQGPGCGTDLDAHSIRKDADTCSPACRTAKHREGKRARFWAALRGIHAPRPTTR